MWWWWRPATAGGGRRAGGRAAGGRVGGRVGRRWLAGSTDAKARQRKGETTAALLRRGAAAIAIAATAGGGRRYARVAEDVVVAHDALLDVPPRRPLLAVAVAHVPVAQAVLLLVGAGADVPGDL